MFDGWEFDEQALGISLLFTVLMAIFMFSVPTWDSLGLGFKILLLVAGLPVYYFVAQHMLNR